MSTAHGGVVSSLLYVVVYVASLRAVRRQLAHAPYGRRPRLPAILLWLVVAVPSLAQVGWPRIDDVLSRQPALIGQGQWWRLLTSVTVQDGGAVGTAYNLLTLALTALTAAALWRSGWVVLAFVAGALVFNVPATLAWRAAGGGNSGATFFLATCMLGVLLLRVSTRSVWLSALVVGGCGVTLLLLGDAHGEAVLGGLGCGAAAAAVWRLGRTAEDERHPTT